jgi:hypothetical protein
MDDIVWLQPKASYATVSAALTLASGRRVALVFPAGKSTCLDDTAALNALHTRSRLLGKEAVIIGGDAFLRARAVAAGFEAATTLDDWGETGPELYSVGSRRDASDRRLWLVTPSQRATARAAGASDPYDGWISEPPDYVLEIHQAYADQKPAAQRPNLADIALAMEDSDDDPLSASDRSERFEEMVIGRILETSGLRHLEIPGAH